MNLADAPVKERTLTGLSLLLQDKDLREALHPFTLDGAHGALLDADHDTLSSNSVQCFEMESLMEQGSSYPVLTFLFHRLSERFDGRPTLLILDEAWLFLDHPLFAARIRDWLKTLRKKNVSVIFATQSLSDIAESSIAPALIESCPTRIFLPNPRAIEPQNGEVYSRFGLNDRQIEIIARATPKRDYYLQSPVGHRLFELGLGHIALALCGSSSKDDQKLIDDLLVDTSDESFAAKLLRAKQIAWAADLLTDIENQS